MADQGIINCLLEPDNPSIRFRTRTELLDLAVTLPEVEAANKYLLYSMPSQSPFKG